MNLQFRHALREDVPAVLALLRDDSIGGGRETAALEDYLAAFDRMDDRCRLIVGESAGRLMACYDLIILDGLNIRGARRAQVEAVRIASDLRGQGLGQLLMADAMARARVQGATVMELMSSNSRTQSHTFYERLGFTRSHQGFKRNL